MAWPKFLDNYKHFFKGTLPPEETGYTITHAIAKTTVSSVLDAVAVSGASVLSSAAGILAAAVIVFSGYTLYDTAYTTNSAFSTWGDIKIQDIVENNTPEQSFEAIKSQIGQTQAEDLQGWISVYDTYINYPLMQGEDDIYYVTHDYQGNSSLTGSIYLAAANSPNLEDAYNIIY
ncbi:MAG: class B sortase, partial [Oscillospiraceae bacterium]|nr:class B sortase [Oscillospiraceae bacterium]